MSRNKIYKITINLDNLETEKKFHPIYKEISHILDCGDSKYIGFSNNNEIFINLDSFKITTLCELLLRYNIRFDILDVTDSVISGDIQKKYPDVEELTPNIFRDFRYKNTDIDDVLDKINNFGIGSIDDLDKLILSRA
jgi:hypothetical protein